MLEQLATYQHELALLAALDAEGYREHVYAGRYLVQAAAQVCIDLANHVVASEGWRVPRDFRDAVTVLEEQGVLNEDLAESLRRLVGLRHRLVHLYDEVDDGRVHAALRDGLADFDAFARAVAQLAVEPDGEEQQTGQ